MTKYGPLTTMFADAWKPYIVLVDEINARCDGYVNTCFARVKSVLREDQIQMFARAELDRARRRVNLTDRMHYSSCVDLLRIIEEIGIDEESMSRLEPTVIAYEQKVTPLVVENEKSMTDIQIPLSRAWAVLNLDDQGNVLDLVS